MTEPYNQGIDTIFFQKEKHMHRKWLSSHTWEEGSEDSVFGNIICDSLEAISSNKSIHRVEDVATGAVLLPGRLPAGCCTQASISPIVKRNTLCVCRGFLASPFHGLWLAQENILCVKMTNGSIGYSLHVTNPLQRTARCSHGLRHAARLKQSNQFLLIHLLSWSYSVALFSTAIYVNGLLKASGCRTDGAPSFLYPWLQQHLSN